MIRIAAAGVAVLAFLLDDATGQMPATTAPPTETAVPATPPDEPAEKLWTFSAAVYTYVVPDDRDYVQPTITADRDWLHLETRYNYEGLESGSLFVGYNFSVGTELVFDFTPMVGGVFGDTAGLAPAYRASLSWWKLALDSEGEYVFDSRDSSDSFFYNWSELAIAPADWCRFGVVTQRTKLYDSARDLQRGLLLGFSGENLDFTGYVFNLDEPKPMFVFAIGCSF